MDQHPVLGFRAAADRSEPVLHRLRARRSAAIQRLDAANLADPFGVELVVGCEHHEDRFQHDRVVERIDRAPEERRPGERRILFRLSAAEARPHPRGGNQREAARRGHRPPQPLLRYFARNRSMAS